MKYRLLTIIIVSVFIGVFTNGCSSINGRRTTMKYNYTINDVTNINDALSYSYDINSLMAFFQSNNTGYGWILDDHLTIDEVNEVFPIELLRSKLYSVFKVSQGGFFFVFWGEQYAPRANNCTLVVLFSSYISDARQLREFSKLVSGKSTLEDVRCIDSQLELCLSKSSGVFSYSLLSADQVVEIEYTISDDNIEPENFVVKAIRCIERVNSGSYFGLIMNKDIMYYSPR